MLAASSFKIMELKLGLNARQELKTELRLACTIAWVNLMAVPDEMLTTVLGAISFNPDSVESELQDCKANRRQPDTSERVKSLYSSLVPSKENVDGAKKSGLLIAPDISVLEHRLGEFQITITPDVTYIGRKGEKPELVFSDHLKGSISLTLKEIDSSKYPQASKLFAQLKMFDDWKRATLRNIYELLGETQREFLEDLDKARLNLFTLDDLANKLKRSSSTVYRLLSNRLVEARSVAGNHQPLYAKELLVTRDCLRKYLALPALNSALEEELSRGKAYSDRELASMTHSLARRTVHKYRQASDIPSKGVRSRAYSSGSKTEPFKFSI